jgi:hypothetical protein
MCIIIRDVLNRRILRFFCWKAALVWTGTENGCDLIDISYPASGSGPVMSLFSKIILENVFLK